MFYQNLKFRRVKNRPFFYTNFVSTVDGKVAVKKKGLPAGRQGYWPIGSRKDYEVLMELRAYSDCLIHGKNLYREFGEITKKSLNRQDFKELRKNLKKNPNLPYLIAKHDLTEFAQDLYKKGYQNILVEGGPTLFASFLKEGFMDEIFLTIAPKIFGSEQDTTSTLVDKYLFSPDKIKKLKLKSIKHKNSEIYLRYEVLK